MAWPNTKVSFCPAILTVLLSATNGLRANVQNSHPSRIVAKVRIEKVHGVVHWWSSTHGAWVKMSEGKGIAAGSLVSLAPSASLTFATYADRQVERRMTLRGPRTARLKWLPTQGLHRPMASPPVHAGSSGLNTSLAQRRQDRPTDGSDLAWSYPDDFAYVTADQVPTSLSVEWQQTPPLNDDDGPVRITLWQNGAAETHIAEPTTREREVAIRSFGTYYMRASQIRGRTTVYSKLATVSVHRRPRPSSPDGRDASLNKDNKGSDLVFCQKRLPPDDFHVLATRLPVVLDLSWGPAAGSYRRSAFFAVDIARRTPPSLATQIVAGTFYRASFAEAGEYKWNVRCLSEGTRTRSANVDPRSITVAHSKDLDPFLQKEGIFYIENADLWADPKRD